jgi:hypothetical protein
MVIPITTHPAAWLLAGLAVMFTASTRINLAIGPFEVIIRRARKRRQRRQ